MREFICTCMCACLRSCAFTFCFVLFCVVFSVFPFARARVHAACALIRSCTGLGTSDGKEKLSGIAGFALISGFARSLFLWHLFCLFIFSLYVVFFIRFLLFVCSMRRMCGSMYAISS